MRKIIYLMLPAVIALLVSCSRNEMPVMESEQARPVTFSLSTNKVMTRATEGIPTRYKVEVYKQGEESNETLLDQSISEDGTGTLNMLLLPGTYTCLFWADYGEANYNIESLKSVIRKNDAANSLAYCLKKDIMVTDGGPVQHIQLKHAVAAISLIDTKSMPEGNLTVDYSDHSTYNVMDGSVVDAASTKKYTLPITATTGETTLATIYTFAPADEAEVTSLTFEFTNEAPITVANVPLQTNYRTVIKGAFSSSRLHSFSVTADDVWEDPEPDMDLHGNKLPLKMGAIYKKDGKESGTIILLNEAEKNALVLVNYDLANMYPFADAEAYAKGKGGRIPTLNELYYMREVIRNETNAEALGQVYTDLSDFSERVHSTTDGQSLDWGSNMKFPTAKHHVFVVMDVTW